jgi:hypothetical protein
MKIGEAKRIVGSIGFPSKMPGTSFGLPVSACQLGSKLAKVEGTVCSKCYAATNFYLTHSTRIAQARRLKSIHDPRWIEAMVTLLRHYHSKMIRVDLGEVGVRLQHRGGTRWKLKAPGHHRWHDAGDLQSVGHLAMICEVARRTPKIKHWLPTNELGYVHDFVFGGGIIPKNLVIRVSGIKIDGADRRAWSHTSSVYRPGLPPTDAHLCPAHDQGNECGSCRACWSPDVAHVVYLFH